MRGKWLARLVGLVDERAVLVERHQSEAVRWLFRFPSLQNIYPAVLYYSEKVWDPSLHAIFSARGSKSHRSINTRDE